MKGIILAGGYGSRLHPITLPISKQLLPIFDKPMIYYPISTLMLAEIREILIITLPEELDRFKLLLGNGSQWGISIEYATQPKPRGLADAFIVGKKFIQKDPVCLILGDNIFYGHNLSKLLKESTKQIDGATIFGYYVKNPQRYGVIEFDDKGKVLSIVEKPKVPKSNYAAVGLYFYDNHVVKIAETITPSDRGELEITDINNAYLKQGNLNVKLMGRGYAWLDTGTHESLIDASIFVRTIEERQGLKISCLEEIAYRMKLITLEQVQKLAEAYQNNEYGTYLKNIK